MNHEALEIWKDEIMEHTHQLDNLMENRRILKKTIEDHLKQFFTYNSIEFSTDFNKIILKWEKGINPVIYQKEIHRIGMDWIIGNDIDKRGNRIVVIEVYPFGVEEGYIEEL